MFDKQRDAIDIIDRQIAGLLKRRFSICEDIGRIKQVNCMEIFDESREKQKIETLGDMLSKEECGDRILGIFERIIEESKIYQEERKYDFGLLGRKLSHSFSPEIHKMLGGYEFGIFEREPKDMEDFVKNGEYKGLCVTIPYKKEAMSLCDEISDTANRCGCINTIVRREDGSLYGDNTDYFGLRYLVASSGMNFNGAKCLVLGNGGAAGTVRTVLLDCFAEEIITISRTGENNYNNLSLHYDADYIINTTPVGMYPDNGNSPVDIEPFSNLKGVIDLIYNPIRTRLVLDAQKKGIKAIGGMEMLVSQAAPAVTAFTGKDVSVDEIERACEKIEEMTENIILIGMPGSGKTETGKVLAEITGKSFVDIDALITKMEDRLPEQIIITDGVKAFREAEERAVREALKGKNQVIAYGGGTVEIEDLYYLTRENARVVYIRRATSELPTEGRPVSKSEGNKAVFERRKNLYAKWSDLSVDNEGIDNTAILIAALMGYYKKGDVLK